MSYRANLADIKASDEVSGFFQCGANTDIVDLQFETIGDIFRCRHCPNSYPLKSSIRRHVRSTHSELVSAPPNVEPEDNCGLVEENAIAIEGELPYYLYDDYSEVRR